MSLSRKSPLHRFLRAVRANVYFFLKILSSNFEMNGCNQKFFLNFPSNDILELCQKSFHVGILHFVYLRFGSVWRPRLSSESFWKLIKLSAWKREHQCSGTFALKLKEQYLSKSRIAPVYLRFYLKSTLICATEMR